MHMLRRALLAALLGLSVATHAAAINHDDGPLSMMRDGTDERVMLEGHEDRMRRWVKMPDGIEHMA
jgi:hypothetical protein